ncbi:hypothetical protein SAMN05661093_04880 [Kibdelosporangium aridum]|uniref:Uncharacterized protein n=1 Tax=Kibdelosporangium aridum TaxID=2030 RepID=A0A1Y5XRH6_KIBAR|nr:hypothetical protein SAMN05661093_04880 [Kibdelosporangium aridum]
MVTSGTTRSPRGFWLEPAGRTSRAGHQRRWTGKSLRGTFGRTGGAGVHLLAACTHDTGLVVGQRMVTPGQSELVWFPAVLDQLELDGDRLRWVRDVTYREGRSRLRTHTAPRAMASLRNLAITALHSTGHSNIAQALRAMTRPLTLLGIPRSTAPRQPHPSQGGGDAPSVNSIGGMGPELGNQGRSRCERTVRTGSTRSVELRLA